MCICVPRDASGAVVPVPSAPSPDPSAPSSAVVAAGTICWCRWLRICCRWCCWCALKKYIHCEAFFAWVSNFLLLFVCRRVGSVVVFVFVSHI